MPRALFPVLSLTLYHAGASGTGFLFASVSAGATIAALTTGWLEHARWLGRIVLGAVAVWGLAIAAAGTVSAIVPAAILFAVAGAADSVSAVCRSTISQTLTPDSVRGRMSSVFSLVVASGPRLGDVEAGAVASAATPRFSVLSGGVACVASVGVVAALFPALARYGAPRGRSSQRRQRRCVKPLSAAPTGAVGSATGSRVQAIQGRRRRSRSGWSAGRMRGSVPIRCGNPSPTGESPFVPAIAPQMDSHLEPGAGGGSGVTKMRPAYVTVPLPSSPNQRHPCRGTQERSTSAA